MAQWATQSNKDLSWGGLSARRRAIRPSVRPFTLHPAPSAEGARTPGDMMKSIVMANPNYATPDTPPPVTELVDTLSDGTKVKRRLPRMRACNEKDAKGKICAGHLKRWYFFGEEVKQKFGADAEIYRCEHCKTLYLPNPDEAPRTRTLAY